MCVCQEILLWEKNLNMSVKLGSINCNGFKSFEPLAQNLLDKCDILCIQELMLKGR